MNIEVKSFEYLNDYNENFTELQIELKANIEFKSSATSEVYQRQIISYLFFKNISQNQLSVEIKVILDGKEIGQKKITRFGLVQKLKPEDIHVCLNDCISQGTTSADALAEKISAIKC